MISSLPKNPPRLVPSPALSIPIKSVLSEQIESKQSLLPKRVEQIIANFKENVRKMNRQQAIGLIAVATIATIALCYKIFSSGSSPEQPFVKSLIQNNAENEIQSGLNAGLVVAQQNVSETRSSISHLLKQLLQSPLQKPNEETIINNNTLPTRIQAFTPLTNRSLLMLPAPSEFCPVTPAEISNQSLTSSLLTSPAIIASPLPSETLPLMPQLLESVATNPINIPEETDSTLSKIFTSAVHCFGVLNSYKERIVLGVVVILYTINKTTLATLPQIKKIKYLNKYPAWQLTLKSKTTKKNNDLKNIDVSGLDDRKQYLAQKGINAFKAFNLGESGYKLKQFENNKMFELNLANDEYPNYFQETIKLNSDFPNIKTTETPYLYDDSSRPIASASAAAANPPNEHKRNDSESTHFQEKVFYVNPANKILGGHTLAKNHGFALEEMMMYETPDMLSALFEEQPLRTRIDGEGPMEGNPAPLLFEGVHRVLNIDGSLYGFGMDGQENLYRKNRNIQEGNLVSQLDQPITYNSLAIAAPRLSNESKNRDIEPLADLFNTLYAGFSLAKASATNNNAIQESISCLIHSTLIGCGMFKNDRSCSICLQALVANHLGVSLTIHCVDSEILNEAKSLWTKAFGQVNPDSSSNIYEAIEMLSKAAKA